MNIAIIGAGNMGGAIARGLAQPTGTVHVRLTVSNPSEAKLTALKADCPSITVTTDNKKAAEGAQLIILAVKPWKVHDVLTELLPALDLRRQSLASLAAGISLRQLGEWLQRQAPEPLPPLYRIIPNTAVTVRQSMTLISSAHSTPEQDASVRRVFSLLGETAFVEEAQLAACTALSSCGIAYVLRYIRAAVAGGVELGLSVSDARDYTLQTMQGAIELLRATNRHPEEEIDRVTTPGGLTIRGLHAMEAHGFSTSIVQGLKASVQ